MTEYGAEQYGTAQLDLGTYLLGEHSPRSPEQAALFTAGLAEQVAARHAEGRIAGPLDTVLRIEVASGRPPRPLLLEPEGWADPWSAADDVLGVGVILVHLLGARLTAEHTLPQRPDAVPEPLWSLAAECLAPDPAARPTAAVLAQQLRGTARDLLLGVAPWPSPVTAPSPAAPVDEPLIVPGYVPGPGAAGADEPVRPRARRNRWLLVGTATVAVVLAIVGVVFALTGSPDGSTPVAGQTSVTPSATPPTSAAPTVVPTTRRASASPTHSTKKPRTPSRTPSRSAAKPTTAATPTVLCLEPDCAARVTFQPVDGHFTVCDNKKDGFSAIGVYSRSDDPGEKQVWASNSVGTCTDEKLALPKGASITFKSCIGDATKDSITACSDPVTKKA